MNAAYLEAGEWWGYPEIASFLGVKESTARDYAADPARRFPPAKLVGGRKLFRADEVRSWHAERPGQGARSDLRD